MKLVLVYSKTRLRMWLIDGLPRGVSRRSRASSESHCCNDRSIRCARGVLQFLKVFIFQKQNDWDSRCHFNREPNSKACFAVQAWADWRLWMRRRHPSLINVLQCITWYLLIGLISIVCCACVHCFDDTEGLREPQLQASVEFPFIACLLTLVVPLTHTLNQSVFLLRGMMPAPSDSTTTMATSASMSDFLPTFFTFLQGCFWARSASEQQLYLAEALGSKSKS